MANDPKFHSAISDVVNSVRSGILGGGESGDEEAARDHSVDLSSDEDQADYSVTIYSSSEEDVAIPPAETAAELDRLPDFSISQAETAEEDLLPTYAIRPVPKRKVRVFNYSTVVE